MEREQQYRNPEFSENFPKERIAVDQLRGLVGIGLGKAIQELLMRGESVLLRADDEGDIQMIPERSNTTVFNHDQVTDQEILSDDGGETRVKKALLRDRRRVLFIKIQSSRLTRFELWIEEGGSADELQEKEAPWKEEGEGEDKRGMAGTKSGRHDRPHFADDETWRARTSITRVLS